MPSRPSPFPLHRFEAHMLTLSHAEKILESAPAAVRARVRRTAVRLADLSLRAWRTAAVQDRPDPRRPDQDRSHDLLRRMNLARARGDCPKCASGELRDGRCQPRPPATTSCGREVPILTKRQELSLRAEAMALHMTAAMGQRAPRPGSGRPSNPRVLDALSEAASYLVRAWPRRRKGYAPGSPYALLADLCAAIRPPLFDLCDHDKDGQAVAVAAETLRRRIQKHRQQRA
jgi:hypothetical protein